MSHSHHLDDLEDKITDFLHFGIKMQKQHEYDCSHLGNANQRSLFNLSSNNTVQIKGNKCVTINTTGNKNRFTMMPFCTVDGASYHQTSSSKTIQDIEVYSAKRKAGWINL